MTGDITRAGAASAGVIAALHGGCFPGVDESWDEHSVADILAMPGAFGFVGCINGEPAGFVLARLATDEAEIISIAVLHEWRRRGLASRLFERTVKRLAGLGCVRLFLEVATDNDAAGSFYRGQGLVEGGRRKDYYRRAGGRTDALILRLDLQ